MRETKSDQSVRAAILATGRSQGTGSGEARRATVEFSSNEIRLSPLQWVIAAAFLACLFYAGPRLWEQWESFRPDADYRLPFQLGNDYWMFARYCRMAVSTDRVLVLGDSVVWGHYVAPDQTLPHYLNERDSGPRFMNFGVDGIHPAALEGLVRYYGRAIRGKRVLVHCNFLWMSSKRHDLQVKKEFAFNHPRLVPQFSPWIPCYRATFSERVGNVVERAVPFLAWARHVRIAYLGGRTFPRWTLEHPYAVPTDPASFRLPSPADAPSPRPVARPWTTKGLRRFDAEWVPLAESFQWRCFCRTIELLRARGNDVFVLIGPFNEHMLTEASRSRYRGLRQQAVTWFAAHDFPCIAPAPLPSDEYADASHPLADGYARLARELVGDESFRAFVER